MKTAVITGSSRGIGLGLAKEFLKKGCRVVLSSYAPEEMEDELKKARAEYGSDKVIGIACDVTKLEQVQALWDGAKEAFGTVDIWMNNAGIANTTLPFWELNTAEIPRVVGTNMIGVMLGAQVALKGMLEQGCGQIYSTEGYGSDDMKRTGLTVYGSTKRAVRYFSESLADEVEECEKPVQVGTISPGIVLTNFLIDDMKKMEPELLEKTKIIYNILGDTVETVTGFLVEEVLKNEENGKRILWLTEEKANARFEDPAYLERDMLSKFGI